MKQVIISCLFSRSCCQDSS